MTFKKRFAVNVGVFVCAIVIFTIVLEATLAVLGINTKSNIRFIEGKGTTYIPHAYYRHTKEGFSEGSFNAHGFRDYERTYEKPQGTFRILVLGDSYTEALQVSLEDTFPAILEKRLNESSSSKKIEVLSLGQSGFGTTDAYMRYINFGVQYVPDLVILAFLTGNDFRNNSKILNHESLGFYFVFDEDSNLVLDRSLFDAYQANLSAPKRIFQYLKRQSYLASLLSERIFLLKQEYQQDEIRDRLEQEKPEVPGALDEFSDLNIYFPQLTPRWKEAFNITKAVIKKFRDSVSRDGVKFVLVTLSNPEQVHPDIQREVTKGQHVLFDFEQPDNLLQRFAKRNEIMFLKLMPRLKEYHLKTGKYLHGFDKNPGRGHWNENGHKIAAETIFDFLRERRLVPFAVQDSLPTKPIQQNFKSQSLSAPWPKRYSRLGNESRCLDEEVAI